jgi:glutamine synthetase
MSRVLEIYGELTFNKEAMKKKLSKDVYKKLLETIEGGAALDQSIAGDVAHAMKEWAIENGATHFTHWFQPQRGGTAEKHDAFISYGEDGEIIERFSAGQLIQSEPDASSFPSGGMRSTFEARGYTAWDPTSPAFLLEAGETKTLVIPTVYLSWTGAALDYKTPYLRSMKAVSDSLIKLQHLMGNKKVKQIKFFSGPEQEYFLVSKDFYDARPDLHICNRTLFGAAPARGQQLEDHYFGAIKDKVVCFMEEFDMEMFRRGIPAKTRHNEVAPNQFEIAPIYEVANLAIDHNLQIMDIMKRVAEKHGMVALHHEKPFKGVNGSGKHYNYSIGDNTGVNYFEPSKSPKNNMTFLLSLSALMLGMNKFGGLLRGAVATAGNDHRLGANEAPPAIMSMYLGEQLDAIMNEIEGMGAITAEKASHINLGVSNIPLVAKDYSDRNRTSPMAFTGNKFEFRAVGSSDNCSEAATTINVLLAYGFDQLSERIEKKAKGGDVEKAAWTVLEEVIKETKRVRFEGNGYSEAWHKEAAKRGLPNTKNTPAALEQYTAKDVADLYAKYGVLSNAELAAKVDIRAESYAKIKDIELKAAANIARTMVIPAVLEQIADLADASAAVKAAGVKTSPMAADIKVLSDLYAAIKKGADKCEAVAEKCHHGKTPLAVAKAFGDAGCAALDDLRAAVDAAEVLVADGYWPMVKYQEILTML